MKTPLVSVVMSVYNGEKYVREAIQSILRQSFSNFEYIIVNDCSTDNSVDVIKGFNDPRIVLLNNKSNIKLAASLNSGIKVARGKYIARMDDDDIALPERLEKQIAFMDANPEVGLLGTYAELFGEIKGVRKHCINSEELKVRTLFSCQFCHPTVMIRKSVLDEYNLLYDETFTTAQDYELWSRMIDKTEFATLPEILLKYRTHEHQLSSAKREQQILNTERIYRNLFNRLKYNDAPLEIHQKVADFNFLCPSEEIEETSVFLNSLIQGNNKSMVFPSVYFNVFIAELFYNILKKTKTRKKTSLYNKFGFNNYFQPSLYQIKLLLS